MNITPTPGLPGYYDIEFPVQRIRITKFNPETMDRLDPHSGVYDGDDMLASFGDIAEACRRHGDPLTRLKEALGLAGTTDNHAVAEIVSAVEKFRGIAKTLGIDGDLGKITRLAENTRYWFQIFWNDRGDLKERKESALAASREWEPVVEYVRKNYEGLGLGKAPDIVLERLKHREALKGENSELKIKLGAKNRQVEHLVDDKNKLIDEVNALQGDLEGARKASEQMCDYVMSFFEVLDVRVSNTRSFAECVADALLKVRDLKAENEKLKPIGDTYPFAGKLPPPTVDSVKAAGDNGIRVVHAGFGLWRVSRFGVFQFLFNEACPFENPEVIGDGIRVTDVRAAIYQAKETTRLKRTGSLPIEQAEPEQPDDLTDLANEIAPPSPEDIRKVANWFLDVAQQLGQSPDAGPVAGG